MYLDGMWAGIPSSSARVGSKRPREGDTETSRTYIAQRGIAVRKVHPKEAKDNGSARRGLSYRAEGKEAMRIDSVRGGLPVLTNEEGGREGNRTVRLRSPP